MPNVLIFKETLLPPSETFILAQMGALTRFSAHLVGLEPTSKGLPLRRAATVAVASRFQNRRP